MNIRAIFDTLRQTPASRWLLVAALSLGALSQPAGRATAVATVPSTPALWTAEQPNFEVEVVASGFQLPINIAFVPNPGSAPNSPFYYVAELYGTIKVVTRAGQVGDYATGLLNFNPSGNLPGSGEQGLVGLAVNPSDGDVFASLLYASVPFSDTAPRYGEVIRLHSLDGGHTALSPTVVLNLSQQPQSITHQISNLTIGPDGKLYLHNSDSSTAADAQNLDSFRGKILRFNLDGSPPSDNPFYNAGDGLGAADYVYAEGFRNPFGGAWRLSDGMQFLLDNGPDHNDRLARLTAGSNYGWDGTAASMTTLAAYNWYTVTVPVNLAVVQTSLFGGSGFPVNQQDHLFVSEAGPTAALGLPATGKRIQEFTVDSNGQVLAGPITLAQYAGTGRATALALAAGPDGLYFSDFYADDSHVPPTSPTAHILRIRYVGPAAQLYLPLIHR